MIPFQHGVFATAAGAASGFESIATVTAAGGETSLTFSSIPQGYASLQIRGITRNSAASTGFAYAHCGVNNDTGSNYARHELYGDGSAVTAFGSAPTTEALFMPTPRNNNTSGIFGNVIIDVHDYASTTRNKTFRSIAGGDLNGSGLLYLSSMLWQSTSAITRLDLTTNSSTWAAGTTFALYGIKAAA